LTPPRGRHTLAAESETEGSIGSRGGSMRKRVCFILAALTAVVALAALPAKAADEIESKAQACAGCHGAQGMPINAATPIIWGQRSDYLYKELHDYYNGARDNPIMSPLVKGFTLAELRELANYFAAKSWPANPSHAAAAAAPEGMTNCRACHGQNYEGGPPAPRLAGLGYDYLLAAMNAFADGTRTNNQDMPEFMHMLREGQRDAIARYLAGL
jgi:cytochrome c553